MVSMLCSLNELPYVGWPLREPTEKQVVREDSVSRFVRMMQQRPLQLVEDARKMSSAVQSAERMALLDHLRCFALAVTHQGWNDAMLPMIILLQYRPRVCNKSVRVAEFTAESNCLQVIDILGQIHLH